MSSKRYGYTLDLEVGGRVYFTYTHSEKEARDSMGKRLARGMDEL
jgi:hypothetical protein